MVADPVRAKALACLREGRVAVLRVEAHGPSWQPVSLIARVRSSQDGHPYRIQLRDGAWSCDCRDGQRDRPCAHLHAVKLVTLEAPA